MLQFSAQQHREIDRGVRRKTVRLLAARLKADRAAIDAALDDAAWLSLAETAVAAAMSFGLRRNQDILAFARLQLRFGPRFPGSHPEALRLLKASAPGWLRIKDLEAWASQPPLRASGRAEE